MTNIINWLVTQNTLLIRIGFTAVLILVGIYIYRTVFKQRVSASEKKTKTVEKPVEENKTSVEAEAATAVTEKAAPKMAEAAATASAAVNATVLSEAQIAEMARLKEEVQKLSTDLAASLAQNEELKKNNSSVMDAEVGPSAQTAKERISEAGGDELAAELQDKIQQLESRLAEYEIIAEDIAEISQLRQENQELRQKTALTTSTVDETEVAIPEEETPQNEVSSEIETIAESTNVFADESVSESEGSAETAAALELSEAELLRAELEALTDQIELPPAEDVQMAGVSVEVPSEVASFNLISEKPVTQTEQELIDQFEQDIDNKKDS